MPTFGAEKAKRKRVFCKEPEIVKEEIKKLYFHKQIKKKKTLKSIFQLLSYIKYTEMYTLNTVLIVHSVKVMKFIYFSLVMYL